MTDDPADRSIAAWAALTQPEPDCDCPPGYKHEPECPLVRDDEEAGE